jgi:hypothetical protein
MLIVAGLAALTLGGCATPIPPVQVTRFHRIDTSSPLAPGSFVVAAQSADSGVGVDASYEAAVSREMERLGYRPTRSGQADYIVTMRVEQARERVQRDGSGVNVGVGGGTGSYGSGVGMGVGLDLGRLFGGGSGEAIMTRMAVRIVRRAGDVTLWEGRAETAARSNTPQAQPGLNADKLATALFANFPGNSGETVTVP